MYLHFLFLLFAIQIGWMAKQCHFIQVSVYSWVSICRSFDPIYDKTDFHMSPQRSNDIFLSQNNGIWGGGAKIINFCLWRIQTRYILHFVLHSPVWLHYLYMFIPNILQHGSKIKLARNNLDLFLGQHHNVSINTFSNWLTLFPW